MTPEYILIHHSATRDTASSSWEAIHRYHTQTNGWRDIGYHYGIERIGEHFQLRFGRPTSEPGAHCSEGGFNRKSIGICLVGDFDKEAPPEPQLQMAFVLCRSLMRKHNIPPHNVLGHREAGLHAGFDWRKGQFKSCPGLLFDMDAFRSNLLANRLPPVV